MVAVAATSYGGWSRQRGAFLVEGGKSIGVLPRVKKSTRQRFAKFTDYFRAKEKEKEKALPHD